MAKRTQPKWVPPTKSDNQPVLKLYNSLTRQKEVFIPKNGNHVTWYSCGPTVYDASHMGHARSYISFDILRRILSDYFGYDICYVMNITDIDDKIIKRARQQHLYQKYVEENSTNPVKVLADAESVMTLYSDKVKQTTDPDKQKMMEKILQNSITALSTLQSNPNSGLSEFLDSFRDPLSEYLDSLNGHTITSNSIFNSLPAYWENEFHADMKALNVLAPTVLTRVSEYVPEIVDFIQKILDNECGYVTPEGSVYFDCGKFMEKGGYYAKLVPEAYGDSNAQQEGEGELSAQTTSKKSPTDFALWKASKPGEPIYPSPWSNGRPGWHIECSAMCTTILGSSLDIHTGGCDLKFPHHDNEIAQTEAAFGHDWCRYFLHSGHLTISGCKMSKSLKNFVTIKEALQTYSARQLRIAFLMHGWKEGLDYGAETMEMAVGLEKGVGEFFLNLKCSLRDGGDFMPKWGSEELELWKKLEECKVGVHKALCDNIDTRSSLDSIRELITQTNIYMGKRKPPSLSLLSDIGGYVTKMFNIFGCIENEIDIGFSTGSTTLKTESILLPYLNITSEFRDTIRTQARALKASSILTECDRLRDDILPNVGVRLEDREDGPSLVKIVDRETLIREREQKKAAEVEKQRKRDVAKAAEALKEAQRRIPPEELFKSETDKYSKFDESGFPILDKDGKELSKGLVKKLQKLQLAQEKKYKEFLSGQ